MKLKNKKIILLTGSTGLFGINYFNDFGSKYNTFFLINKKNLNNIKKKIYINLDSKKNIREAIIKNKINTIIHAAGFTNIDYIEKNKKISYKNNFLTTKNISEVCKETSTKLVFISTDQLFSGKLKKHNEKTKVSPVNYYGYLKSISENEVNKNSKKKFDNKNKFFWCRNLIPKVVK